jgi:F-type H+-transporting ATPase subunit epsilon
VTPFEVGLVSPEAEVWRGEATMLVAKTVEGEIGILAGHQPFLGQLAEDAEVRITTADGGAVKARVSGGFLSVSRTGVSVLAEVAELD